MRAEALVKKKRSSGGTRSQGRKGLVQRAKPALLQKLQ